MESNKIKMAALVAVGLILFGGLATFVLKKSKTATQQSPAQDLRTRIWPKEREEEIARIKKGQLKNETVGATLIDLSSFVNTRLDEAPSCWKGNNDNNLCELPEGTNIYAGVPFKISGSIQLAGGWLKDHYQKDYPTKVSEIPIDRICTKLHLLHGNNYIAPTNYGTVVSKVVFHYTDSSTREIQLVAGEQAFDFWYPLFKTGLPKAYTRKISGTERAWTGSNAHLRKWQPELSLVLYRTTLENPQPSMTLKSIDFVSAETITAPFVVALTVE